MPNLAASDTANTGAHWPPLITNAHSPTNCLNTKFAKFTLRNGGPVQHQVSKHGRECTFYLNPAASKNAAAKIQTYGFKILHQHLLADRNKSCFPDRAAKNCRE